MLKKKVATLEGIDEKYHNLYTEQEDGSFVLDSELAGDGDIGGLKSNNEALKAEKELLQEKLNALKTQMDSKKEDELSAQGKYEELLQVKEEQFKLQIDRANERAEKAVETLKQTIIQAEVQKIAVELAGAEGAEVLLPHIEKRIQVNEVGGEFKVQVTDVNGNPTNNEPSMLIEEFKSKESFAPFLKGRNSNGGGSGGGAGGAGAEDGTEWEKYYTPNNKFYSPLKQAELADKDPELHKGLVDKFALDDPFAMPVQKRIVR